MDVKLNLEQLTDVAVIKSLITSEVIHVAGIEINDATINPISSLIVVGGLGPNVVSLNVFKIASMDLAQVILLVESGVLSNGASDDAEAKDVANTIFAEAQDAATKANRQLEFNTLFPDGTSSPNLMDWMSVIDSGFRNNVKLPDDPAFLAHFSLRGSFQFEMVDRLVIKPDSKNKDEKTLTDDDFMTVPEPKMIIKISQLGINGQAEKRSAGRASKFPIDIAIIDKAAKQVGYTKPKAREANNTFACGVIRKKDPDYGKVDGKLWRASELDQDNLIATFRAYFPDLFPVIAE